MFKSIVFLAALTSTTALNFYRKDYTYFEEYDAYYKLHFGEEGKSWSSAFMACDDEGAKLFYPKEEGEWNVAKNLSVMPAIAQNNVTKVVVGIHDAIWTGQFITVDGQPTPMPLIEGDAIPQGLDCVLMDVETGGYEFDACITENANRPFICKKVDDKPCPTIDLGYKYSEVTKKCYKVNNRKKTWDDAWHTCFMEGGMLVSPQTADEAKVIFNMLNYEPWVMVFAGFRKILPNSGFYTVRGTQLDAVYQLWYDKPNEDSKDCGAIYKYSSLLYTRSVDCRSQLPYVCEMQARN